MSPAEGDFSGNESSVVNVSHNQHSWLLFKALSEHESVIKTNSKV